MKAIISHDVDHITVWEHRNDLIVPKFIVRGFIEFLLGYVSASEIKGRLESIVKNKWHNLDALMQFDQENGIHSTFFFGVSKGLGLNYEQKDALYWIRTLLTAGFDVGVHGIAFNNYNDMKDEFDLFKNLSGLKEFGIRMHYLRRDDNTFHKLNQLGYTFDTTKYVFKNPYLVGRLFEFPLHIMDSDLMSRRSRWQDQSLDQSKETTKKMIEDGFNEGLQYFTILFHDSYFSDLFMTWRQWYIWLIDYLKDNKIEFISYNEAIKELKGSDG